MIGELNMYRESGIKPNFSDIARRYGKDRHTVAAYWRADGCQPPDGRRDKAGSFVFSTVSVDKIGVMISTK